MIEAVFLLSIDDLPELITAAAKEGLTPRISDVVAFARQTRVVPFRHDETGIRVDVSLGMLPFEVEMVERSTVWEFGDLKLRLPTAEDLIILKAVAHRPKDLIDIQSIIKAQSSLDRARIAYWVHEFARTLEMPELWDDIAHWLRA